MERLRHQEIFTSPEPRHVKWRVEQMRANNAIEGIPRDAALDALVAEMEAAGVPIEEQIKRIASFDMSHMKTAAE